MTLNDIDKLVRGRNYSITVLEDNQLNPLITEENQYIAEYRGLDKEEFYLLFWVVGESNAFPFYYKDIISFKVVN